MSSDSLGSLLVTLIVFLVIFLAAREIMCWYWKINELVGLQKESVDLLRKLVSRNATCPECKEPIVRGNNKCPHCGAELEWGDATGS
jgi:hypothetical protein